jgi:thymidylate synthase (FAD)
MQSAKLISYSQGNLMDDELWQIDTPEQLAAYCARVSNPANQNHHETSNKLIQYLIKHKHWSPLEMVSACVEVTTTRDIARQLLRHRSFSFQEFSQRYADPTDALGFVTREARLQDQKNRQNSIELDAADEKSDWIQKEWTVLQEDLIARSKMIYEWAINNGIAKEQARVVLPEGLTVSKLYVSGTLRSFIHYIEVRSGNGTQKEHMELARAISAEIAKIFPSILKFVQP